MKAVSTWKLLLHIWYLTKNYTLFNNFRTTDNKKVPSFGSSSGLQTEPESEDASSLASATTLTDETEKDDENQTDSTSNTDEAEDTFLRRVISELWSVDQQQSVSEEMSDEMKNEDVREDETAESVLQETALMENTIVEDTLCQVKSSCEVLKALLWYHFLSVKKNYTRDNL